MPAVAAAGLSLVLSTNSFAAPKSSAVSVQDRVDRYARVELTADLNSLSRSDRRLISLLVRAANSMDDAFWMQAYGDRDVLFRGIDDSATHRYVEMNYGPWDRLDDNLPFMAGAGQKPDGANFYPKDMTKSEFEQALSKGGAFADALKSSYTMIRRGSDGSLKAIPYHEFFRGQVSAASGLLRDAGEIASDPGLKRYLALRSRALLTDEYLASDLAWLDMKDNGVDIVIGPIETYEDRLYGYKASYEAFVLVKDKAWSQRLAKYAELLPGLQRGLPVEDKYKRESPGTDSDLNAYDVVYYAGDCNAGAKTIAINLPNDERVQLQKGTRRLQLKNAMRAKFDKILLPIADVLIAEDQRKHITFDAFFANTMFHEVAHGLGIKKTIDGKGTVREALKELSSALEEGKADILGLYMVTELYNQGVLTEGDVRDNYVTFLAGIFRSVRFGAASAHGRANMLRFNYFRKMGAFARDEATGTYRADFDKMRAAMTELTRMILKFQGDGDYAGVEKLMAEMGHIGPGLQADLDRLAGADVPVDVVFEQGMSVLGR
jgi:hypothetical protein